MSDELEMRSRGQVVRAVVRQVDDTGSEQRVLIETHASTPREAVVHQPFGFASHAPADGAVTTVLAAGGDEGDMVALPPSNPQAARFGNLGEGESVLYDSAGQRVHLIGGRIVAVVATQAIDVTVDGKLAFTLTSTTATFAVDLVVQGKLTASGDVVGAGVSLRDHLTGQVQPGGGTSGKPLAS